MTWDLPIAVEIDGKSHAIRNNCDFRVVLDVMNALNDVDLEWKYRVNCALIIFYDDIEKIDNIQEAIKQMFKVINNASDEEKENNSNSPKVIDWSFDYKYISPAISGVLGYDIRTPGKYTHWWTFLGAYSEVGSDSIISNITSIRSKKAKGKKLEKWEEEFYREHRSIVDLPQKLTEEEQAWLNADW